MSKYTQQEKETIIKCKWALQSMFENNDRKKSWVWIEHFLAPLNLTEVESVFIRNFIEESNYFK